MMENESLTAQPPISEAVQNDNSGVAPQQHLELSSANPLDENVIERAYTKPNFAPTNEATPIPEPVYQKPNFEDANKAAAFQPEGKSDAPPPPFNPALHDMEDKDKLNAANQAAETVLDGYAMLNKLAERLVRLDSSSYKKAVSKGTIDPNLNMQLPNIGLCTVQEYVEANAEAVDGAFEVDDEFKEKVKPVLGRVLAKKGVAMTDEQVLMYHFGTDIAVKGFKLFTIVNQNKQTLKFLEQVTEGYKAYGNHTMGETPQQTAASHLEQAEYMATQQPAAPVMNEIRQDPPPPPPPPPPPAVKERKPRKPRAVALPSFGDKGILEQMQSIANNELPNVDKSKAGTANKKHIRKRRKG